MAIKFTDMIVEPGVVGCIAVAKTAQGRQRIICEITPSPTKTMPFRVRLEYPDGTVKFRTNLGTAVEYLARSKGLDTEQVKVIKGTTQHLYR